MELKNLNQLMLETKQRFNSNVLGAERMLPEKFKELVPDFDGTEIKYNTFTAILIQRAAGLDIYFPNQWFYIAAFMTDYYHMIKAYKEKTFKALKLQSLKDAEKIIRPLQNDRAKTVELFDSVNYHETDRDWLINFLSDYEWWGGGKSIDRNDFYVSPVLALAKLVNASQSFIADICKFLAEHPEPLAILKDELRLHPLPDYQNIPTKSIELPKATDNTIAQYLRAMRTKPFLLLAGISGTGKSRIVKQMAFDCCPDFPELRRDATSPGNYCLVEVKPNWHDSSELIGYSSQIGKPHYVTTPFVRFLAKAMLYEDERVPFFVCLDEMNLAPVEQYFAEFLSVLESRKVVDGRITSEALIPAEVFKSYDIELAADIFGVQKREASYPGVTSAMKSVSLTPTQAAAFEKLKQEGLRIPSNLIVIGTVNMDETTHQFSRKVIDRAMTIEMNLPEGEPFMDFFNNARDLEYSDAPLSAELFLPSIVKAADAVKALAADNAEETEWLKKEVATILTNLNAALEDTPFKISYRVQNELILYFHELWKENMEASWQEILNKSVDQILMMKVLPRVEGDEDLLEIPLENLANFCAIGNYSKAKIKVDEMQQRLNRAHFTSYWP